MIFFDLSVHIVHRPCRSEEIRMSDLVVIVSPAEAKAEEVRKKLFDLQKQYSIELSEAIIAMLAVPGTGTIRMDAPRSSAASS